MIEKKMLDEDAEIIFDDEKTIPKKESKLKRILLILITLFILANVFMYIGFYNNYVTNSPSKLKEARKEMIKAHIFSIYEVLAIRAGFEFDNAILLPLQKAKEYFYYKGIKKFPENEGEKAYWFALLMFYPIDLSMNNSSLNVGSLAKENGLDFAREYLTLLNKNLELLTKYGVSDYENKYIKGKLVWFYFTMYTEYVYNYHLDPSTSFFTGKSTAAVKDKKTYERLLKVYTNAKEFLSNKKYEKELILDIKNIPRGDNQYYKTFFNANTLLLFHLMYHEKFQCNNKIGIELSNDYIKYKTNLKRIIKEKKISFKKLDFIEYILNTKFIKEEQNNINRCKKGNQ